METKTTLSEPTLFAPVEVNRTYFKYENITTTLCIDLSQMPDEWWQALKPYTQIRVTDEQGRPVRRGEIENFSSAERRGILPIDMPAVAATLRIWV